MKTIALLLFAALFVGPLYGQTREDLLNRLADLQKKGYMVGHQDDPFYGLKWSGIADPQKPERGRSDVKEVVGDYPAVMGFDLGGIEMGDEKNLDGRAVLGTLSGRRPCRPDWAGCLPMGYRRGLCAPGEQRPADAHRLYAKERKAVGDDRVRTEERDRPHLVVACAEAPVRQVSAIVFPLLA